MPSHPFKLGMEVITNTEEIGEVVEIDEFLLHGKMVRVQYNDPEYRHGFDWYYANGKAFCATLTMEPRNA